MKRGITIAAVTTGVGLLVSLIPSMTRAAEFY
jgi:hypothetical protein